MSKNDKQTGNALLDHLRDRGPIKPGGFYRPHKRSDTWYTGELLNPKTGEMEKLPSMTKQEFRDETDINNILRQYKVTGMINHINAQAAQGKYEDLPDPLDFQASLHLVRDAQAAFDSLPSRIRDRFQNNANAFLEFCSDPRNQAEMQKLGISPAPAPEAPPLEPKAPDSEPKAPQPKA